MLTAATPGQILEVARYSAATLARASPQLYGQFLAGLSVQGNAPETTGSIADPAQAVRLVVADRRKKWLEACKLDEDVKYWQQVVDTLKEKYGASASVDSLILTDEKADVRKYQMGKVRREALLRANGLERNGSNLVPVDDTDATSDGGKRADHKTSPASRPDSPTPARVDGGRGLRSSSQWERSEGWISSGATHSGPPSLEEKVEYLADALRSLTGHPLPAMAGDSRGGDDHGVTHATSSSSSYLGPMVLPHGMALTGVYPHGYPQSAQVSRQPLVPPHGGQTMRTWSVPQGSQQVGGPRTVYPGVIQPGASWADVTEAEERGLGSKPQGIPLVASPSTQPESALPSQVKLAPPEKTSS